MKNTKLRSTAVVLSIIIPVYNAEKHLSRCLDSIVLAANSIDNKQIEVILIDDGSQDDSYSIAKTYCDKHLWMQLLHQKNRGPSSARNKGLERAKGLYTGFIDCDDTIDKNYFSTFFKSIKHEPDIIVFGYKRINLDNEARMYCPQPKIHTKQSDYLLSQVSKDRELFWYPHTKWFKSAIIKNIRFDENMRLGEDTIFNLQAVLNATNIIRISAVLYSYYETIGSLSSNSYKSNLLENMERHFSLRLDVNKATKAGLNQDVWSDIYDYYIFHILPWLIANSNHLNKKNQLNELIQIRESNFINVCYDHGKKLGSRPRQILIQTLFRAKLLKTLQRYLSINLTNCKNSTLERRNFENT